MVVSQYQFRYFYPRPLRRGRRGECHAVWGTAAFLSTPSSQRATAAGTEDQGDQAISIHALFAEGDYGKRTESLYLSGFLSTPSSQRATSLDQPHHAPRGNFYPRPLRRGRRYLLSIHSIVSQFLSTPSSQRATPAGLDQVADRVAHFYPRPLRRGRRQICPIQFGIFDQFVYKLAAFEPVCVK